MKKFIIYGMISLSALSLMPTQLRAEATPITIGSRNSTATPEAQALLLRLDEINAMDKKLLTSTEKKELRKEVRSIKRELKTTSDGVYLSVGAIIIIVLLLILLL